MPEIEILELDRGETMQSFAAIGRVYHEAFAIDDAAVTQRFLDAALSNHVSYPEFRIQVAQAGDEIVGFTYGYRSEPGRWWHDTVRDAFVAHDVEPWLDDAWEFVEFAVLPQWQGNGIGTALHDGLLNEVSQARALLSTEADDNPARDYYLRRGWVDLVPRFTYPGGNTATALMGLDLDVWRATQVSAHVE